MVNKIIAENLKYTIIFCTVLELIKHHKLRPIDVLLTASLQNNDDKLGEQNKLYIVLTPTAFHL